MLLFAVFAVVAHELTQRMLDRELGARLRAVAAMAATQIRGKYLVPLGPGDEGHRAQLNALRKLEMVAGATGVARLYVFDQELRSRADTAGARIGERHFQAALDRHELGRVFGRGESVASVLFEGQGGQLYKAGYAPVRATETEPEIVLALGAEAPAAYFAELAELRQALIGSGAVLTAVVLLISAVMAARITRPVRRLAAAAERIGKGALDAPVERGGRDELGLLADTMDEMRRELKARDERMQMMLAGIAHEVRNPLGGIELFTGILREELAPDDERRGHVERISRELSYLEAVVREFLDYARRPEPELAEVALEQLLDELGELLRGEAEAAGVALSIELAAVRCLADAGQLRRAVLNLLQNAVEAAAGAAAPRVWLTLRAVAGEARIAVGNSGPVIPEEVRVRMFEPFFTTREKGTGLGLAFTREIVSDHGGFIEVTSDAEQGTEFVIHLPVVPDGAA